MSLICPTIYLDITLDKQMSPIKKYRRRISRIINPPPRPSPNRDVITQRRYASFQIPFSSDDNLSRPRIRYFSPLSVASFSSSGINARVNQNPRRAARRIFHGLTVLPPLRSVAALMADSDKAARYYPAAVVF